jgi:hypothetical protein
VIPNIVNLDCLFRTIDLKINYPLLAMLKQIDRPAEPIDELSLADPRGLALQRLTRIFNLALLVPQGTRSVLCDRPITAELRSSFSRQQKPSGLLC